DPRRRAGTAGQSWTPNRAGQGPITVSRNRLIKPTQRRWRASNWSTTQYCPCSGPPDTVEADDRCCREPICFDGPVTLPAEPASPIGSFELEAGDAGALLRSVPDGSVDLICTDPPYNLAPYSRGNIAMSWRSDF